MKTMALAVLALTLGVASPAFAQTPDTGVWAASKAWNAQDFAQVPSAGYPAAAYAPVPGPWAGYAQVPTQLPAPWGAYAQAPGSFGAYAAPSPDAGLGGDYVGTDPDPNVQLELLKDAQSRE